MNYVIYLTSNKKYGVKKEGGKRALKTFDDKKDAYAYASSLAKKGNGKVIDQTILSSNSPSKKKKTSKKKIQKIILTLVVIFIVIPLLSYIGYRLGLITPPTSSSNSIQTPIEGTVYEEFQMHFMQLGNNYNGDAIYIKAGENDILIDAGVRDTSTIKKYMNQYVKDNKLEYVIVTHGDADHIEGFIGTKNEPGIFDSYAVDVVIDSSYTTKTTATYQNYVSLRDATGAKHYTAKDCYNEENGAKRIFTLAPDLEMEILWNKYYFEDTTSDENNYSVVTRFRYKNQYFLFTGDLEKEGEKAFVEHYKNEKEGFPVALYKAGHHGSPTSSNSDFLNLIQPSMVVVSCSAGNSEYTANYKNVFPSQDFVTRIKDYTDQVYVTSYGMDSEEKPMNGNIIVSCAGEDVALAASNNLTKLKDTEWFNSKIYVDDKNNFVSQKGRKDYFTKDSENVHEVPFRVW